MIFVVLTNTNNSEQYGTAADLDFSGTCTELPIGKNLKTNTVFPVKKGTEVIVNCIEGFTLASGDRSITCVQDADFTSSKELPTCIIGTRNMTKCFHRQLFDIT